MKRIAAAIAIAIAIAMAVLGLGLVINQAASAEPSSTYRADAGIPPRGAIIYGVGQGDGGPLWWAKVRSSGRAGAQGRASHTFDEAYGANAGLILVKTARQGANGSPVDEHFEIRTTGGRVLRTVASLPDDCRNPLHCWPMPGGARVIHLSLDGSVTSIDSTSGAESPLAQLTSTFPDAKEISYGGAMSPHSLHLYVNDNGVLTRIDTTTGAKTAVVKTVAPDMGLEPIPFCATTTGRVLAQLSWYEGDPSTPPWGLASIDPRRGTYKRLALDRSLPTSAAMYGCTADGRYVVASAPGFNSYSDSWESWITVSARTGKKVGLGGNAFTNLSGPFVDNGVGR